MECSTKCRASWTDTLPFLALAGGAGILGGVLLTEAFEHHEDEVRQDAYDQGKLKSPLSAPLREN